MRPTPRTQPYRAGLPRMAGQALDAMLAGRAQGQLNGGDFNRQRMALQKLAQQRLGQGPMATADVRGQFGNAPMQPDAGLPHGPANGFGSIGGYAPQDEAQRQMQHMDALQGQELAAQDQVAHAPQLQDQVHPMATADVRGTFGGGGWGSPHVQAILQQLLNRRGPTRVRRY